MDTGTVLEISAPQREIKPKRPKLRLSVAERMIIVIIGDILLLLISLLIALWIWQITSYNSNNYYFDPPEMLLIIMPWLLISLITDSYNPKTIDNLLSSLKQPLRTALIAWLVYACAYFFARPGMLPRRWILIFGIASCLLLISWRYLHFLIFSQVRMRERVLIISDDCDHPLIKELQQLNKLYYEIADCICLGKQNHDDDQYLNFADIKNKQGIDKIILALQQPPTSACLKQILDIRESGVTISLFPVFYGQLHRRLPLDYLNNWNTLHLPLQDSEFSGFYPLLKRLTDLLCALIGLTIFVVLFPILAIALRAFSYGPMFFSQIRVGKNGRKFRLWKLRTMVVNADQHGPLWTRDNDVRITPVGRIIRKLHLDELPQFWNVLKGELSVVGVRPLTVKQCEIFEQAIPLHNMRHLVTPGLTSWAVVNYRHVNDIEGARVRLEYDLYYIKHQSIWIDWYIIFRTIWTMATMNGL